MVLPNHDELEAPTRWNAGSYSGLATALISKRNGDGVALKVDAAQPLLFLYGNGGSSTFLVNGAFANNKKICWSSEPF